MLRPFPNSTNILQNPLAQPCHALQNKSRQVSLRKYIVSIQVATLEKVFPKFTNVRQALYV